MQHACQLTSPKSSAHLDLRVLMDLKTFELELKRITKHQRTTSKGKEMQIGI